MIGGPGILLLPLLAGLGSAVSDLEPPSDIWIRNQKGNLSATWNWKMDYDNMEVNFTVFYQEFGMAASEIPGCVHIEEPECNIPSELLDFSKNYTLHVRVETPQGNEQFGSVNFQPNLTEWPPTPTLYVVPSDGLVKGDISTPVHPVDAKYIVVLQHMNSGVETEIRPPLSSFQILYCDLHVDEMYCLRAQIYDLQAGKYSPFSAAHCFMRSKALPENLRVEGINTIYLLKWDWDYQKNPNVTFSVQKSYSSQNNWGLLEGCENITTSECNVSSLDFYVRSKLLVSVYNAQTDEHNSSIVTFLPMEETLIGPPTNLKLTIQDNDLHIAVEAPEGFRHKGFQDFCTWMYHLKAWKNSAPMEVIAMESKVSHFTIKAVKASETYCANAHTRCEHSNRTGLYSETYCIATDPRSYVKEWIIGSVFGAIIVISIILYICLCPLKRYLKHVFFPKSKLPSSIEKGLQDSPPNYINNFFLLNEEETTDKCYIMQNSPVDAEVTIDKNNSGAKGRDSGNYSNEDEVTGDSAATSRCIDSTVCVS
ncbi:interferon alpha/beta receptor 1-like isoform X1 [Rana temporaria]|uniref:interferon alpha/beta receptor 1-like isoform X1 n=1 Tax=Rana temporaria TaxID=8407 RepID=UPI001AAD8406|nr:interferon alpha/beta receptor 1-like isoform X1 [Rana temporaria]